MGREWFTKKLFWTPAKLSEYFELKFSYYQISLTEPGDALGNPFNACYHLCYMK